MSMMLLTPEERQRRSAEALHRLHPMQAVGNGPWRVLSYCEAETHNSLKAARKAPNRCICPRACDLLAAHSKRQAELKRAKRAGLAIPPSPASLRGKRKKKGSAAPAVCLSNVTEVVTPDLTGAACRTRLNMVFFDMALEGSFIGEAKAVCRGCPVRAKCAAWVTKAEAPAGAWGGVYGALSVTDRKRLKEFTA